MCTVGAAWTLIASVRPAPANMALRNTEIDKWEVLYKSARVKRQKSLPDKQTGAQLTFDTRMSQKQFATFRDP
ncbi:MAG: hypothetical protein ACRERW_19085, partial [Pseudomonas sp.]